ncbi:hypothetical protein [Roseiconus lacunae]|uniref:hypothetical protein n=1 Tax=Roseiconus lacunae TaxID=2605694 RepID=UPI0011F119BB|nr:hypothetical protein [Roseiconus lacunae]
MTKKLMRAPRFLRLALLIFAFASSHANAQRASHKDALLLQLEAAKQQLEVLGDRHPSRGRVERSVRDLQLKVNAMSGRQLPATIDRGEQQGVDRSESISPSEEHVLQEVGRQSLAVEERSPGVRSTPLDPKTVAEASKVFASKRTLRPKDLKFYGGYRIPAAWIGNKSTAFSRGGLTGRWNESGELQLFLAHHATANAVAELTAPADLGEGTDANRWPEAIHVRNLTGVYDELRELDGRCQVHGVHVEPDRNRLWVSGRSIYNTTYNKHNWLVGITLAPTPQVERAVNPQVPMQPFGGGFVDIPRSFSPLVGGNVIGLAKGGYESGQGSATSPTLAAFGSAPTKVLMYCKWQAPAELREKRDSNYRVRSLAWQPEPANGTGYWGVDRVMDTAWIDNDELSAFIAIVLQPAGDVVYRLQGDVFCKDVQYVVYVYPTSWLVDVAAGKRSPDSLRGQRFSFEELRVIGGRPKGVWYDKEKNQLHIVMTQAWRMHSEKGVAVAVYDILRN